MAPRATAAASSVVPAPDAKDPHAAAALAAASVKMEEFRRNMIDYTEKMTSLGLIPSRPPPKRWFSGLAGCFSRLARLWRLFLVRLNPNFIRISPNQPMDFEDIDILQRQGWPGCFETLAIDRQLVKDCLDLYNRQHPGNEYEPVLGNASRNPHLHNGICWTHGNFVARKKGSGVFSFLTAPRSVFFYELAYMNSFHGVVTCTPVEEPAYSVLGYPLWWARRTSGKLDSFCKTCYCRFGIPRPGVQKIFACGHNNMAEVCEMCYCRSDALHPDPGEFAFGYHHPYRPYPNKH
ncbi:hypothetical protein BDA96_01G538300 [Sorghum bicolor]|uniref:DUF3615 domain-containing protein n=1 Tax=Sorghum bicolor TaxID=4558 RepID=A0A921S6H9_SORBI|nr:hypothetical protein BDA96_01G538300 [Sorghum bicolor]